MTLSWLARYKRLLNTVNTGGLPLLLTTMLLAVSLPISADENNQQPSESTDEQSLLFGDLPSVFTASRHEQPITKAPASVDVITSEQIKRYGWRTVSAMLGSLPGFLSTYDRAYNHVGVRGFAPPGDYNTRILVLIDGHRVNESLQDYAGLGRDFLVDVETIDRVEVVRGPASSLYGSSAFFAVVNVITQRGRDLQGTRMSGEVASFGGHQGQISHGQKFSNGLETLISASYYHSDGHEHLFFPGKDLGTANNLDGEQVERLSGKLGWEDLTLSGSFMQRKKYLPTGTAGADFGEPGTHYHDRRAYADLNYRHRFDDTWDVTGRLFWDIYEFTDDLNSRSDGQRHTFRDQWQGQWFGGEALINRTFFDKHRLTLGTEFRRNFLLHMTNNDVPPADNRLTSSIYGIYLQDEWSILDNLDLQAGGRYDHYDSFGDTANPRLGLIYEPVSGTTLKLLYGTAFRAPNTYESSYACCQGTVVGNASLKPEQIETFEFVLEQRLDEHFDLRVSPYHNVLTDHIEQKESDGFFQFGNFGSAKAHGVETQLQGHFENIEGRLSHTYQQSRSGNAASPNAPSNMVKLNLSAPLWAEKLFAGLEVQYVSQRTTVAGQRADSYTVTNLTLLTRHWLQGVELTGGIYNLFDQRYVDPASSPLKADIVSQDGLNMRLRMSVEF